MQVDEVQTHENIDIKDISETNKLGIGIANIDKTRQ